MKKFLALTLACTMLFSLNVAAGSPSASTVVPSCAPVVTAPAATTVPVEVADAEAKGMTVAESVNNTVVSNPAIPGATPVGQGGRTIINGKATNLTFVLAKPSAATVASAKTLGGKLLNVVNIKVPVKFDTAQVPFYMPGVVAGQNIVAYQLVDGQWVQLATNVRVDHLDVLLKGNGPLAFVLK